MASAALPGIVLVGAAVIGAAVGVAPSMLGRSGAEAASYSEPLFTCTVTDGDTIRCGDERIRLLGIDAPELPGHCRQGRDCAKGDGAASAESLRAAMVGSLTIERVDKDRYGRTLALVAGDKGDLSCWQLRQQQAIYKVRWDNGLRVRRKCPGAAT